MGIKIQRKNFGTSEKILIFFLEIVSTNAAPPNPLQNIEVLEYHYVRSSQDRKVVWADAVKHCDALGCLWPYQEMLKKMGDYSHSCMKNYFHPDQPNGKNGCVAI